MFGRMLLVHHSPYNWKVLLFLYRSRPLSAEFLTAREMDMLSEQLKLDPCFHILTSPVNSRKSMIVKNLALTLLILWCTP